MVEQSPDAVLLPPLLLRESLRLIEEMSEKNIANVLINTNLDSKNSLSYIGQDSYQSGVLAARLLDFGLADGDHALVLNLDKGVTNAQHLMDKERGFKTYFSGLKGKNIEIHAAIFEEFDSPGKLKSWVSGFLEQCPKLNGIFVTNSRAWVLAAAMNPETLKKLKIVGFDLIEENLELLRGEQIDFLLNQNAWYQGYLGIMTIVNKLILKKEIPPTQFLPLDIVVKENVGYYLSRTLELPTMVM